MNVQKISTLRVNARFEVIYQIYDTQLVGFGGQRSGRDAPNAEG